MTDRTPASLASQPELPFEPRRTDGLLEALELLRVRIVELAGGTAAPVVRLVEPTPPAPPPEPEPTEPPWKSRRKTMHSTTIYIPHALRAAMGHFCVDRDLTLSEGAERAIREMLVREGVEL